MVFGPGESLPLAAAEDHFLRLSDARLLLSSLCSAAKCQFSQSTACTLQEHSHVSSSFAPEQRASPVFSSSLSGKLMAELLQRSRHEAFPELAGVEAAVSASAAHFHPLH